MHEVVLLGMIAFTALIICLYIFDVAQEYTERSSSHPSSIISTPGFTLRFIIIPVMLILGVSITAYLVPDFTVLVIVVSVFTFSAIRYSYISLIDDEFDRGTAKRDFSIWRADYRPTRIARLVSAGLVVILGIVWIYLSPNRDDASSIFLCAISPPLLLFLIASRYQDMLNTLRFFLGDEREE